MTTIALLRGVNVGGSGKLPMADLKEALVAAGAKNPETYIQSGNAVFGGKPKRSGILDEIESRAGFRPALVLIDGKTFLKVCRDNPFHDAEDDPKSLHIFFMAKPKLVPVSELKSAIGPEERIALGETVLYLHTPKYLSGSKIAPRVEKLLGVPATARNWTTVSKLADMIERRT